MLDAIRLYKQQVLGVTNKATLQEAADAFIKYQEHERRKGKSYNLFQDPFSHRLK